MDNQLTSPYVGAANKTKMKTAIETEHMSDYATATEHFRTKVPREVLINEMPYAIFQEVVRQVADIVAKKVLEEKFDEIMQKISPEAIANMAIAEASAAVNETLHKKMPDKILEIEKRSTEVYQRGVFGGLRRLK